MSEQLMVSGGAEIAEQQETYRTLRGYIIAAQRQISTAVNSAVVAAYWNIGKNIYIPMGKLTLSRNFRSH